MSFRVFPISLFPAIMKKYWLIMKPVECIRRETADILCMSCLSYLPVLRQIFHKSFLKSLTVPPEPLKCSC